MDEATASECRRAETAAVNEASDRPLGDAEPLGGLGERQPRWAAIDSALRQGQLDALVHQLSECLDEFGSEECCEPLGALRNAWNTPLGCRANEPEMNGLSDP